jgi:hypothetical protein
MSTSKDDQHGIWNPNALKNVIFIGVGGFMSIVIFGLIIGLVILGKEVYEMKILLAGFQGLSQSQANVKFDQERTVLALTGTIEFLVQEISKSKQELERLSTTRSSIDEDTQINSEYPRPVIGTGEAKGVTTKSR